MARQVRPEPLLFSRSLALAPGKLPDKAVGASEGQRERGLQDSRVIRREVKSTGASLYEDGKRLPPTPFSPKRKASVSVTAPGVPVMVHADGPETEQAETPPYPPEPRSSWRPRSRPAERACRVRLEEAVAGCPAPQEAESSQRTPPFASAVSMRPLYREVGGTVPSKGSSTHGSGKQGSSKREERLPCGVAAVMQFEVSAMRVVLEAARLPERPGKPCTCHASGKAGPSTQQRVVGSQDCGYCHLCPEGELKNRKKSKARPCPVAFPPTPYVPLSFRGRGHADGGFGAREAPRPALRPKPGPNPRVDSWAITDVPAN